MPPPPAALTLPLCSLQRARLGAHVPASRSMTQQRPPPGAGSNRLCAVCSTPSRCLRWGHRAGAAVRGAQHRLGAWKTRETPRAVRRPARPTTFPPPPTRTPFPSTSPSTAGVSGQSQLWGRLGQLWPGALAGRGEQGGPRSLWGLFRSQQSVSGVWHGHPGLHGVTEPPPQGRVCQEHQPRGGGSWT